MSAPIPASTHKPRANVDGATVVSLNGAAKGTIPGEPFNRALTKIWLGDKPAQADVKKAMLGG